MPYLAMTAAEVRGCDTVPEKMAWMACHFSPYGTGLTNLPARLPEGSLLILNDRTPVHGHDPKRIRGQLEQAVTEMKCRAVLLDLQRQSDEVKEIIEELQNLPCPVIVSAQYAAGLRCPVFLPPVPLLKTVGEYIKPWKGREIWLEAALDGLQVTLTAQGSSAAPLPAGADDMGPHRDDGLFCHYGITVSQEQAVFTLGRTADDLRELLAAGGEAGVCGAVGLYQELGGKL